jgi:membrane protein implicated in regulation of membrane protease activity
MLLLVAVVLLLVLPSPWGAIGFAVGLVAFGGEVVFWNARVRGRRASVGVETLVGTTATVTRACRPEGQVRAGGEIWAATCVEGADPGETVVVARQEGLRLVVERAAR